MRAENTNEITVAPSLTDIDVTSTFEILSNTDDTSLREVFPPDVISDYEVQSTIDYRNAFKQGDVITEFTKFYDLLTNTYFKQADFSLENILYWAQKLKSSNKELASYYSQASFNNENVAPNQFPGAAKFIDNNYQDNKHSGAEFLENVSDSIGIIANSKYIQLDSTLPLFDVQQQYYGVPIPYSASTESKISANTRNVAYDLSQKTTAMMRRNLLNVGYTNTALQQNLAADATVSHGLNLINDLPTFVNINKFLPKLTDKMSSIYPEAKIFGFIKYLCNIGNDTAMSLRDIFPIQPDDMDFTVITSEEKAMQSQEIANKEVADAQAAQALSEQYDGMAASDNSRNNSQIGNRPYAPTDNLDVKPTFAAPLEGSGTPMNSDGKEGTSLRLSDVEATGMVNEKAVSTYGGQMSDLSTYFDTKPSERDPEATAYYLQKYGADKLQRLDDKYRTGETTRASYGILSSANQYQGAYVGNKLTAGFDVGIGKGDYPPRTLLRITDAATGKPIDAGGANPDGIYRVGDTGSSANLRKVGRDSGVSTGALDFYAGNNPAMTKYYSNLNGKGVKLRVEVVKAKA